MNSRQRVIATLNFHKPDRPPLDLWVMPQVVHERAGEYQSILSQFPLDFSTAPAIYPPDQPRMPGYTQPGQYVDEWGCTWQVNEPGVTGEVVVPRLADWEDLDRFTPPWEYLAGRSLAGVDAFCAAQETFVLSEWTAKPFERMQFLRGSEALYMDLADPDQSLNRLLGMVHEFFLEDIRQWCKTGVDGIVFSDDWGSNNRMLIAPSTWRKIFKPLYLEYADLIHSAGKSIFFHSDGYIEPILDELISEIGIDAINMQTNLLDKKTLLQKVKGKVTLWGEVDRQHLLPFGTPAEIRDFVFGIRDLLGEDGGVIGHCVWNSDNSYANILAVYQAYTAPFMKSN
jgi:uroporphyrinogen decarboxylase